MRIGILFTFFLMSCSLPSSEKSNTSDEELNRSSPLKKEELIKSDKELPIEENPQSEVLKASDIKSEVQPSQVIHKVEQVLMASSFKSYSGEVSTSLRRAISNQQFVSQGESLLYKNDSDRRVSLTSYVYKDIQGSIDAFNYLWNLKERDYILKGGGVVYHFGDHIIYIMGACNIDRDHWKTMMSSFAIDLPRIECFCGGSCSFIDD